MKVTQTAIAILVFAVSLAGGAAYASRHRGAELADARHALTAALARARHTDDLVAVLQTRGAAAEARADSAAARADSLARTSARTRVRYVTLTQSVPAECVQIVQAADHALAAADSLAATRATALQSLQEATKDYRAGLDSSKSEVGQIRAAAVAVDQASRPGLLERLAPRAGVGVAAGYDPIMHRPATVVGVTFGWRF